MNDRMTHDYLNEVVDEWTGDKRVFTAFEATIEAKRRGMTARHRDVRDAIHELMQIHLDCRLYSRDLVHIPGIAIPPFLYFPRNLTLEDAKNKHPLFMKVEDDSVLNEAPPLRVLDLATGPYRQVQQVVEAEETPIPDRNMVQTVKRKQSEKPTLFKRIKSWFCR